VTHFAELFTANAISILRNAEISEPAATGAHLVPDIYLSWDKEAGDVDITLTSIPGLLLNLSAKVAGTPGWLSLNLSLGRCSFQPGEVLGIVVELEGCANQSFPMLIRSNRDGTLSNTYIDDILKGSEDRAVCTLLHKISAHSGMTDSEAYHTLIIPLPRKDFQLSLRDMRLFIIPASHYFTTRSAPLGRSG
jgi:hypothetical protein